MSSHLDLSFLAGFVVDVVAYMRRLADQYGVVGVEFRKNNEAGTTGGRCPFSLGFKCDGSVTPAANWA